MDIGRNKLLLCNLYYHLNDVINTEISINIIQKCIFRGYAAAATTTTTTATTTATTK